MFLPGFPDFQIFLISRLNLSAPSSFKANILFKIYKKESLIWNESLYIFINEFFLSVGFYMMFYMILYQNVKNLNLRNKR